MALSAVLALCSGCVLPQEDQPLDGFVLKNRPPRILEYTVYPILQRTRWNNKDCPGIEFSARVEDPDINDVIRYRWYIDYDQNQKVQKLPVNDGTLVKDTAISGTVTLTASSSDYPQLQGTSTHIVTLLATDGNLNISQGPGSQPDPDLVPISDGGTAVNPRYSVSYSWVVDFDPAVACPLTTAQ